MPKPKRTCSLRTICRRAKVPRKHADALFMQILEATLWGDAVSVPRMGKFWLQPFPGREAVMPVKGGASATHRLPLHPGFALRFSSSRLLRDGLRTRIKGRARGTGWRPFSRNP